MTSTLVTVRHNFETGHRLPFLRGKCENLHGHSWWATVTVEAPFDPEAEVVVEFGTFKAALRGWIDTNLDHGLMLGHRDPLAEILPDYGKVYVFDGTDGHWPTVENTARMLARVSGDLLRDVDAVEGAHVAGVRVQETHVNEAAWTR